MPTRIIAITLLGLIMGFIILMASVTFFVREPLPIVGANQTLLLHSTEFTPQIRSTIAIDGGYWVDLTVEHAETQSPEVILRPVGGQPLILDTGTDADGAWSGAGQMTRPGRWELVLSDGETREIMQFIVRE